MAKLHTPFNSSEVEPQAPRELLPDDWYTAEITNADVKALKSGNGTGLNVEYTVIDPEPYAKRKVWQTLNIQHSNPQAEQIGQAQLSSLCRAAGIVVLADSDELFQKIVRIKVTTRPAKDGYKAQNEVGGHESASAGAAPTQAARPAASPAAAKTAAMPWQKKAA